MEPFDPQDPLLDPACRALCGALNKLTGIQTTESCCGHGKDPYRIWFKVHELDSRGFVALARLTCPRYYPGDWKVYLFHGDTSPISFVLENCGPRAEDEAAELAREIEACLADEPMPYNILRRPWPRDWYASR